MAANELWQRLPKRASKRRRHFGAATRVASGDDASGAECDRTADDDTRESGAVARAPGVVAGGDGDAGGAATIAPRDARDSDARRTAPSSPSSDDVRAEADASNVPRQYEYLDHTADVQLHAWCTTLPGAFAQCALAMYGYMTDLERVALSRAAGDDCDDCDGGDKRDAGGAAGGDSAATATLTRLNAVELEARGHDVKSLLYNILDECLYHFSTEYFIMRRVQVLQFEDGGGGRRRTGAVDATDQPWRIRVRGYGERFSLAKHEQGTEVKAITYSAMQVMRDGDGDNNNSDGECHDNAVSRDCRAPPDVQRAWHVYVIVDI